MKGLMSATFTSWFNKQLVKIHLPEGSLSQGRLVCLRLSLAGLLQGPLVKIHLPGIFSEKAGVKRCDYTCQRLSQRRHLCSSRLFHFSALKAANLFGLEACRFDIWNDFRDVH